MRTTTSAQRESRISIPHPAFRIPHSERRAFTMIELLVVIAIISVLMGILLPAIQRVREGAKRAQAMSDIGQLSTGVSNFMSTQNCPPPPANINIAPSASGNDLAYLKRVWPRLAMGNVPSLGNLDGNRSLQFFLGGPGFTGFSDSSSNPFAGAKSAVSFDFPLNRIKSINGIGYFVDPWDTPYFYMSSYKGNDYNHWGNCTQQTNNPDFPSKSSTKFISQTVTPLTDGTNKYVNQNTFQILSAGSNRWIGAGGAWTPGNATYAPYSNGGDDLSNFHSGQLSAP